MVKNHKRRRSDPQAAFARLESIARRPNADARLVQMQQDHEARRARGERTSPDENVAFGLVAFDAGRIPVDAAMFFVTRFGVSHGLDGPAERRISEVYERNFKARFDAIRKKHGLGADEDWALGEGPPEAEALNAEFDATCGRVEAETLDEYADRTGHPLLKEAAELCRLDSLAFERRVEKGRQWFFGPPDAKWAKALRSKGIID
ncbi:MAG: hypothetical protein WBD75_01925 [Phycisphaerae bacterium]